MAPRIERGSDAIWIEGKNPVLEALRSPNQVKAIVTCARNAEIETSATDAGIEITRIGRAEFEDRATSSVHQGVMARVVMPHPATIAQIAKTGLVVALDGITDPQNFGAIARSADAFGASLIITKDRAAPISAVAVKASAGALLWLKVATVVNLARALEELKQLGVWTLALDGSATDSLADSNLLTGNLCLVVGAEGKGVSRLVADRCDARARIDIQGRVQSLNASVAAGIALSQVHAARAKP